MADTRPLIERLAPDDAERLAALIDERDSWRTEVLGLRARVAELEAKLAIRSDSLCEVPHATVAEEDECERQRLAVRDATAARVAELKAERETDAQDVRAVVEACADFDNDEGPRGIRQLYARFADRIAALGQQNDAADGSA